MFKIIHLLFIGIPLVCLSCQSKPEAANDKSNSKKETIEIPLQDPDARVIKLEQVERQTLNQTITVPDDKIYIDIFKQAESLPPVIDILVIIDNSYSMEEEQLNLADKLTSLISDLNEVDWQINVITTDNICRRIPELPLNADTPNMEALFKKAVKAGINGSGYETGLKNAADHTSTGCNQDPDWLRENTDLAILVVSDEDEDSYSRYYNKPNDFLRDLKAAGYVAGENFKFYGIIGHPSEPCPTVSTPGATYAAVVKQTEGLWGSICAPDYGPTLKAISRDIRLNLKIEFPLRFKPVLSTIKLTLDGSAYSGAWTIIGQKLILAESLPEGSTLAISYQVESFRLIQLGVDSEEYQLASLSIDGEVIDPTEYNYDRISNFVLLMFDPTPGAKIESTLFENKNLLKSFSFPDVTPKKIACYLDSVLMKVEIEVKRESITLNPVVPAGKTAHCLYNI
jgi:hypothetical protein